MSRVKLVIGSSSPLMLWISPFPASTSCGEMICAVVAGTDLLESLGSDDLATDMTVTSLLALHKHTCSDTHVYNAHHCQQQQQAKAGTNSARSIPL